MTDLKTAPITLEEIKLWQESTPADYAEWDWETVSNCDRFLTIALERLDAETARADGLRATLVDIRDSTYRSSFALRRIAARALEDKP